MKKIRVISYSQAGAGLNMKLCGKLRESHAGENSMTEKYDITGYSYYKYPADGLQLFSDTGKLLQELFSEADLLVFICAAGIAVRETAAFLEAKTTDPAVVVMDDAGKFVISMLSGHLGGANAWTEEIAALMKAVPVITTSTDCHGKFAVDCFAAENGLVFEDYSVIRRISAAVLKGEPVGFYSEIPVEGKLPDGLIWLEPDAVGEAVAEQKTVVSDAEGKAITGQKAVGADATGQAVREDATAQTVNSEMPEKSPEYGIVITEIPETPAACKFPVQCTLYPKNLILGIGCKKGKSAGELGLFVRKKLEENGISQRRVKALASIDRKAEEAGICGLAEQLKVPFLTYTAAELESVPGDFKDSEFVKAQVGTGNVCERSALYACGSGGRIVTGKQAEDGMTMAVGRALPETIYFKERT